MKIAVLPGDGIGPEIIEQAKRVLDALRSDGLPIEMEEAPLGGAAYDQYGPRRCHRQNQTSVL